MYIYIHIYIYAYIDRLTKKVVCCKSLGVFDIIIALNLQARVGSKRSPSPLSMLNSFLILCLQYCFQKYFQCQVIGE